MKTETFFKYTLLLPFCLWIIVFALLPFLLVFLVSLMQQDNQVILNFHFTFQHYIDVVNPLYLKVFVKSFYFAGLCALCCLILGYPVAYWLAKLPEHVRPAFLMLMMIPFWTSSLVRSYAMITLLKNKGLINSGLLALGIIHQPLSIMFTNTAVMITLIYNLLPFMILPLYANIERIDDRLIEAAQDLGANLYTIISRILIPLSLPGIMAGSLLVLLPAMTIFYVPDLLGGAKSLLLGNVIENEFLLSQNWPMGSTISVLLSVLMGFLLIIYRRINKDQVELL